MLPIMCCLLVFGISIPLTACQQSVTTENKLSKTIVVTYSIMGSLIRELIGDKASVIISIPNGLDLHEWEPSAKDIEAINKADLVIQNGVGLEHGLEKSLDLAKYNGVPLFTASDYITLRQIEPDEISNRESHEPKAGVADPHFWMDPLAMKQFLKPLAEELDTKLGLDVAQKAIDLEQKLDQLNSEISISTESIKPLDRNLVTGHRSMGYFAQRYGFTIIGVIIPSLSSQSGVSAGDLATLKTSIEATKVKAIFTEVGTSTAVAKAIGAETGVKVIELTTHYVPSDNSYFTFMRNLSDTIVSALK
jgi:zinc/manganese transport system substrate-binding protein